MSFSIVIPPFNRDNRGNKLDSFAVRTLKGKPGAALVLCGPGEVFEQIRSVADETCVTKSPTEKGKEKWTHALYFERGVPQSILDLCEDLQRWLSIPSSPSIDFSLSLDWYKQPNDDGDLIHTAAGTLIYHTKYATNPDWSSSKRARRDLLTAMAEVIAGHPSSTRPRLRRLRLGARATDGSFGELLGRDVAKRAGLPPVPMQGPARPPQKQEAARQARRLRAQRSGRWADSAGRRRLPHGPHTRIGCSCCSPCGSHRGTRAHSGEDAEEMRLYG